MHNNSTVRMLLNDFTKKSTLMPRAYVRIILQLTDVESLDFTNDIVLVLEAKNKLSYSCRVTMGLQHPKLACSTE